jgi:hypothetical protein
MEWLNSREIYICSWLYRRALVRPQHTSSPTVHYRNLKVGNSRSRVIGGLSRKGQNRDGDKGEAQGTRRNHASHPRSSYDLSLETTSIREDAAGPPSPKCMIKSDTQSSERVQFLLVSFKRRCHDARCPSDSISCRPIHITSLDNRLIASVVRNLGHSFWCVRAVDRDSKWGCR